MSDGPYTTAIDNERMAYADSIAWCWIECNGERMTMKQVAETLNTQHAKIERLREALSDVIDAISQRSIDGDDAQFEFDEARVTLEDTK